MDDIYTGWYNCTMGSGYLNDRIQAQFCYRVEPTADKSSYTVSVYTRLRTKYYFNWSGAGTLTTTVSWTGGLYSNSLNTETPLYTSNADNTNYIETDWNGPLTFSGVEAKGITQITISNVLDFSRTTGLICEVYGTGPCSGNSSWSYTEYGYDHDHYKMFVASQVVDVSSIPLVNPSISAIDDYIFGGTFSVTIADAATSLNLNIKFSDSVTYDFAVTNGKNEISFTQAQLDAIYKLYTRTSSKTLSSTFTLSSGNTAYDTETKDLTLTGNAKTAHCGVSNSPRRAKVWVGVNGERRRAVVWVGDSNNKPRRCI